MGVLVTIGKLKDTLYVCNGCCCGHDEKGNPVVLNEFIESQLQENKIDISLERPYCLGPCSQANVIKITLDKRNYWFGRMNDKQDIIDLMKFIKTREFTENLRKKEMEM